MKLLKVIEATLTDSHHVVQALVELQGDLPLTELLHVSAGIKQGKKYTLEIKEVRKHRSLNANSYAWVLMQKIAEKLGITKEEVYRENVRSYGTFTCITIQENALDEFKKAWSSNGIGWQIEVDGGVFGYLDVLAYPGTSTYDSKQMSRFIDGLVNDCKDLGIETLPEEELESIKKEWGK